MTFCTDERTHLWVLQSRCGHFNASKKATSCFEKIISYTKDFGGCFERPMQKKYHRVLFTLMCWRTTGLQPFLQAIESLRRKSRVWPMLLRHHVKLEIWIFVAAQSFSLKMFGQVTSISTPKKQWTSFWKKCPFLFCDVPSCRSVGNKTFT